MRSTFILLFLFSSLLVSAQAGTLDSLFDEDGKVQTNILGIGDLAYTLAIQADQKIVVAGISGSGANVTITVARYLPDGSLDEDFGGTGIVSIDYSATVDRAQSIAIQPDGKIVLGCESTANLNTNFSAVRLLENGAPDPEFGTNGKATLDLGQNWESVSDVAIQPDGKIVLAGRVESATFSDFAVVRFTDAGLPDEDFGEGGRTITSLQDEDDAQNVIIQADGKIVVGGYSSVNAIGDYAMVRYLEDGTLDKFFGIGGKVITDVDDAGRSDLGFAMLLDRDNKLVQAGWANFTAFPLTSEIGVVRYYENGDIDSTFAENGRFVLKLGENTHIHTLVQQPDGKYLIGGDSDVEFAQKWIVVRLLNEGGFDPDFGEGGIALIDFNGSARALNGMALQQDGKIVVAGTDQAGNNDFALARLKNDLMIGTKDLEEFMGITLLPNPADHTVTIQTESAFENISLHIMNAKGEIISAKSNLHLTPNGEDVDVSNLPEGIYFIWLENKEGFATLPFTKIK